MKITRFEDIESWQIARDISLKIYSFTQRTAFSKDFGLRDQSQRSAVPIMANIAEGYEAGTKAEFIRFLTYSQRSCSELQSELYVALDQQYIARSDFDQAYELIQKCKQKIGAFIKYLKTSERK